MLSKDLTPNPKAVNIIRPSNDYNLFTQQSQFNYSSSTDSSSCTFSTASTNNPYTTLSPMIRQPSIESNPGLSFFCQTTTTNNNIIIKNKQQQQQQQQQKRQQEPSYASFEKIQSQPLVISRINLSHRRPTTTDLDDIDTDDDEGITMTKNTLKSTTTIAEDSLNVVRLPSFKTGFGVIGSSGGAGLASFMLRGNIQAKQEDARVSRKIQDLEIEKKSLLTLNKTLETVVKEQSNTISDLKDRLAAIERPLTPGLDTSLSKNGIMSSADILEPSDLERYLEDEDAAYERIRIMLLDLIEQAQSAVSQNKKVSGRVLTNYDVNRGMKRNEPPYHGGRPRSVAGDKSITNTRNFVISNQQNRTATRRVSLGSIHSASSSTTSSINGLQMNQNKPITRKTSFHKGTITPSSSPTTSPIPHRRYSVSPTLLANHSTSSTNSVLSTTSSRASKYNIKSNKQQNGTTTTTTTTSTTKKWSN
ncbi:hypothetical protein BD770DRAFT_439066 [Pilaira anomala]|nr:hypothetical protein BD770DRAFT_439066 [Pilaira anomala]